MGRRKIEIKPIRDDRNRSVTFLKRKGGLFKKAHELSVLCSVDVAVVIFGHNKKLYEYSSSDINEIIGRFQYYGGAHEHKGPADFADKTGGDDDDEDGEGGDDMGGDEHHRGTPQPDASMMHPHMANHPGFQHVRHGTPHASPPMHNGAMPQFTRGPSPLPPGMTVSRPNSRNAQHPGGPQHIRRTSSNLGPQHPPGAPPSYAYQPNPPFYNPQAAQMAGRPPPGAIPPPGAFPAPYPPQPPQHPHMQQAFMEEQRRTPMPPNFAPQPAPPPPNMQTHSSAEHLAPPGQQAHPSPRLQQQQRPTPSPQPPQGEFQSPPLPQPKPMPAHAKTHSIFTPIDDSRSMLAQHWGGPSNAESRPDPAIKIEGGGPRSQSIDVAQMQRDNHARANGLSPRPPPSVPPPATQSATQSPQPPHRTVSTPIVAPPARSGTQQTEAKRPRLKVQIPSEQSGDEGGTAESAQDTASEAQTANTTAGQPQVPPHGVVLPPPSPSAGALLSAGAQGPPNPFARPAPPMSTNPHAANREANHIETPLSALPSRFMNNELLPSPSAFYPSDWNTNMLPSPFTFQTPVAGNGPSWRTEEEQRKRANDDLAAEDGGDPKRAKT